MDREEDIRATRNLFEKAEMLDLTILRGRWDANDSLAGIYLPNFSTLREYFIQVKLPGDDILLSGHYRVNFIIVPVEDGEVTRYKIIAARDIDWFGYKRAGENALSVPEMSWGEIKILTLE